MIYQIGKCIGAMAAVLEGEVDGILLGGGMAYSGDLVARLRRACGWIAPVTAYPGEFEMEAMAAGAERVLAAGRRRAATRVSRCGSPPRALPASFGIRGASSAAREGPPFSEGQP